MYRAIRKRSFQKATVSFRVTGSAFVASGIDRFAARNYRYTEERGDETQKYTKLTLSSE